MLNINAGYSQELLNNCPVLKGYVTLVQYIRRYRKQGKSPAEAAGQASETFWTDGEKSGGIF